MYSCIITPRRCARMTPGTNADPERREQQQRKQRAVRTIGRAVRQPRRMTAARESACQATAEELGIRPPSRVRTPGPWPHFRKYRTCHVATLRLCSSSVVGEHMRSVVAAHKIQIRRVGGTNRRFERGAAGRGNRPGRQARVRGRCCTASRSVQVLPSELPFHVPPSSARRSRSDRTAAACRA